MYKLIKTFYQRLTGQLGASATQYGIIIAGVALALIFVFSVLTGRLNEGFDFIINTIRNAVGS
jgi:Flp pilus assembly pilin Flp